MCHAWPRNLSEGASHAVLQISEFTHPVTRCVGPVEHCAPRKHPAHAGGHKEHHGTA